MINKMNVHGRARIYKITLPDKTKIKIWFIGDTIEKVLKAYNIPYEIEERDINL